MEELRSTDILDKEILEDARKKAQRILGAADETIKSMDALWDKKTGKALSRARKKFDERLSLNRTEIMARLPLDKRRVRSEKIEGLLMSAASSYFAGLSRDKHLAILESELKSRFGEALSGDASSGEAPSEEAAFGGPLTVRFRGLSVDELEGLLAKTVPPGASWAVPEDGALFSLPGTFPAVVVNTEKVRITASVDAVMEGLLRDKREELVSALLGPAVLGAFDALSEEERDD
jgi:hypothetical protein